MGTSHVVNPGYYISPKGIADKDDKRAIHTLSAESFFDLSPRRDPVTSSLADSQQARVASPLLTLQYCEELKLNTESDKTALSESLSGK